LGLLTTIASRTTFTEVAATQTLAGFTDLAVDGAVNTRITSASHSFGSADLSVVVTGGTGWTPGTYTIGSLSSNAANLSTSPAAVGSTGGKGSIVRSTGYSRVALPNGTFGAASAGRTQNNVPIALPAPTGDWGTILSICIFDALTAGNLLAAISTTASLTISAGDAAKTIAAGGLIISRS
jgi:hypothetical protein